MVEENNTIVRYPTGQTRYTVPFDYLARPFVVVTLISEASPSSNKVLKVVDDYTFFDSTHIDISAPQEGFDFVQVHRFTSSEPLVDFQDGSVLTAGDLTTAELQAIHISEEGRDQTVGLAKEYADSAAESASKAKSSEESATAAADKAEEIAGKFTDLDGAVESTKESARQSEISRKASEEARQGAEKARDEAEAIVDTGVTFPTVQEGLAGTSAGQYFRVPNGSGGFTYYLHNGDGTASAVASTIGEKMVREQFETTKEWVKSIFSVLSDSNPGGVVGRDVPLLWDDSVDPKVIMALRSGFLEVLSGVSFTTAMKTEEAVGQDPRLYGVMRINSGVPLLWDDSVDPKVIMALRNRALEVYSSFSFSTALKVEEALGQDPRLDGIVKPAGAVPLLWDDSVDPKVVLYMDTEGVIQAPGGFGEAGGVQPKSFEVTQNSYVSQNVRSLLHSVKAGAITRRVKVLLTGHSWTDFLEIPAAYREQLQPVYGDGGIGYQSFNPTRLPAGMTCESTGFTKRTIFTSVTADGTGINGRSLYAEAIGATVTFAGLKGSTAVISYQDLDGSFTVKLNDEDAITVTGGGTNTYKTLSVPVSADSASFTLTTTTAGKVNLFGISMENPNGVSVYSMGNAGCNAHDYVNHCIKNYPDVVPKVDPDVVLILLGTNEVINKVPPNVYRSYLTNLVRAWKANVKAGVGINIVSCAHTLNTSNSAQQVLYPPVERQVALNEGVGYVDGFNIFPRPPVSSEAKLFANTEHLNANGAAYFSTEVLNKLLGV